MAEKGEKDMAEKADIYIAAGIAVMVLGAAILLANSHPILSGIGAFIAGSFASTSFDLYVLRSLRPQTARWAPLRKIT